MSKIITIIPGNTREYHIYDGIYDVYVHFTDWENVRKVKQAEFRIYPIDRFKIKDVNFCAGKDQLEIFIKEGAEAENPFVKKFEDLHFIKGNKESTVIMKFEEDESYDPEFCFDPDSGEQPERKKGNILVGG